MIMILKLKRQKSKSNLILHLNEGENKCAVVRKMHKIPSFAVRTQLLKA